MNSVKITGRRMVPRTTFRTFFLQLVLAFDAQGVNLCR